MFVLPGLFVLVHEGRKLSLRYTGLGCFGLPDSEHDYDDVRVLPVDIRKRKKKKKKKKKKGVVQVY